MKTNEMIAGLRKLCGQGSEYRRTVCRLAADLLEHQQKRIEELEAERTKPLTAFLSPIDAYKGLKRKFLVFKSDTGEMVENCFVLRPDKDPAAVEALRAYARATDNATLSADIVNWVGEGEERCWIPVTERLPKPFESVLAYIPSEAPLPTVHESYIADHDEWVCILTVERYKPGEVTHWMPMPEMMKEGV